MTVETFLGMLAVFSAATSVLTQGIKKIVYGGSEDAEEAVVGEATVDEAQAGAGSISNIIALVVALAVGCGGTVIYYIVSGIEFSATSGVCIVVMGLANWLCAMFGYDKVKQTIEQISS